MWNNRESFFLAPRGVFPSVTMQALLCLLLVGNSLYSQSPQSQSPSNESPANQERTEDRVVATWNDKPIRESDVRYRMRNLKGDGARGTRSEGENVESVIDFKDPLVRSTVELIADQWSVQQLLDSKKLGATESEVNRWLAEKSQGRKELGWSEEAAAKRVGLSVAQWKREMRWQLTWERYLEKWVTEKEVRAHFEKNPDHFNGTKREVYHLILLAPLSDASKREAQRLKLEEIRTKIVSGKKSFEEAVKEYSEGVTAKSESGRLGWLAWDGPMDRSFIEAAFELQVDQISPVVGTPFGWHLIVVKNIEPGEVAVDLVFSQVRSDLIREKFLSIAAQSQRSPVVYP